MVYLVYADGVVLMEANCRWNNGVLVPVPTTGRVWFAPIEDEV